MSLLFDWQCLMKPSAQPHARRYQAIVWQGCLLLDFELIALLLLLGSTVLLQHLVVVVMVDLITNHR